MSKNLSLDWMKEKFGEEPQQIQPPNTTDESDTLVRCEFAARIIHEYISLMKRYAQCLPLEQLQIFTLKFSGWDARSISEVSDIRPGTVDVTYWRIVENLFRQARSELKASESKTEHYLWRAMIDHQDEKNLLKVVKKKLKESAWIRTTGRKRGSPRSRPALSFAI